MGQKDKNLSKKEPELTAEDLKLKEEIELLATRATDEIEEIQTQALNTLGNYIKEAVGTMSSIPKPLKFLRPHFQTLKEKYETIENKNKQKLADILSILAMTLGEADACESLHYRLKGTKDISVWGHEYIRSLCGEISTEWARSVENGQSTSHLESLIVDVVTYHMAHNAESEAVDLLLEVNHLSDLLPPHVNSQNCKRVTSYLLYCTMYLPHDEALQIRKICIDLMRNQGQVTEALRIAMMINDRDLSRELLVSAQDHSLQKQMALMLGSQQMAISVEDDELMTLINNEHVSKNFLALARELDVLEPKTPADIFKTSTESGRAGAQADSARLNLASTLVNAFVNAAFGNDKVMDVKSSEQTAANGGWVFKNKEHGMLSAVASVGMIMMWDVENGLSCIDRYMYMDNENVIAGALLGCGIVNANVRNECDPALALLGPKVDDKSATIRSCALLGLGLAYAGSAREDIQELLVPSILDSEAPFEVVAIGGLALGLVFTGSCNADVVEILLQCLLERSQADLKHPLGRFLCLAMGLIYLGKGDQCTLTLEACQALDPSIAEYCVLLVQICAFATSGDVLQIQKLLEVAGRHPKKEEEDKTDAEGKKEVKEDPDFTRLVGTAVMGIGVIAMGDDIGTAMATRMTNHLMQFGDHAAKRSIPLCLAMLYTSNAEYRVEVTETLHKLSHDPDPETSMCAILGLGIVGAGTNNSRIADTLRQLSSYYEREPAHVFVVKIAQGFLHMGKGLLTLSPFHSDRVLLRPTALAALLTVGLAGLDFKNIILQKYQFLLFTLSLAMRPRMLVCLDEEMQPLKITVRVGQAVDTVGQAGNPKTITAFQTHTSPVLLHQNERAEIADDDYTPITSTLEGFVIVRSNKTSSSSKSKP
eukprot:c20264_g1_i1.p1 GENE.c20264_g1_i1~~c20264_g1_i1.p1  ORF type:complete len:881 (-),score=326.51 c20264_g1_i1:17-2659(-)